MNKETRCINAIAPVRICDIGGWTDTWFAKNGAVLNLAVYPQVEVQIKTSKAENGKGMITINAENFGDSYIYSNSKSEDTEYYKHPLIEAAISSMVTTSDINVNYDISIYSSMPPGASTGTSAAVSVALIAAFDKLFCKLMTPYEIARHAHKIETDYLHLQCGVQDQFASACGGINFIQINNFPNAIIQPLQIATEMELELQNRLAVIYIGKPHQSSQIHEMVIKLLENNS